MKLKKVLIISAIFGLIILGQSVLANDSVSAVNPGTKVVPVVSNVEISNISSDIALVSWLSNYPDISYIVYGTEDTTTGRNQTAVHKEKVTKHYLPLKELKPDTVYYFRVVSDYATGLPVESQSYHFKTLSSGLVTLAIVKIGDGLGTVTSGGNVSQNTPINCGDTCQAQFPLGTTVTLKAIAKDGSKFVGWSGDCESNSITQCLVKLNNSKIITAKFALDNVIGVDSKDRNIPRVMFWWGKVNQHWNLDKGVWETDPDGISGARENKLAYCQKFYPTTTKVIVYKKETTNTWRNVYNQGKFTSIKVSYRCVLANENVTGEDVSNVLETPDAGSICHYYPNLDYCRPFGGINPGVNPPALKDDVITSIRAFNSKKAVDEFISHGISTTTQELTFKERADAVKAYKTAFNKLPENQKALADTAKIANGEIPTTVSVQAETKAKTEFKKIYKRSVDLKKPQEASVIKVMAYGISPVAAKRNLEAEKAGVAKFVKTYKRLPKSDWDWNIVKAISYANDVK